MPGGVLAGCFFLKADEGDGGDEEDGSSDLAWYGYALDLINAAVLRLPR